MMNKHLTVVVLGVALALVSCQGNKSHDGYLQGKAEGLWNEEINLADYNKGVTIINPYSPSNCGYCFFDGDFIRENYARNAIERGDAFLGMCLFNPQRDIYTFQKHYRKEGMVITSPINLYKQYHNNGFPWVTIVRDGEKIYQDVMTPYDFIFDSLSPLMWPDNPPSVKPTSPLHLAGKFINENEHMNGIEVIPDNDTIGMRRHEEWIERVTQRYSERGWDYHQSYNTIYESDLSETDLTKNIELKDKGGLLRFEMLRDQDVPVKISDKSVSIGNFTFPREDITLFACFPNPYDREKFVKVSCPGRNMHKWANINYVDYIVSRNTPDGEVEVLLQGHFDKSGPQWKFDPQLAVMSESIKKFCSDKGCPLPLDVSKTRRRQAKDHKLPKVITENPPHGQIFTIGGDACRLPRIAVDNDGTCWVTWEEAGDILLASAITTDEQESYLIESDSSDSFDPVIATTGNDIWVFYLNNIEGHYRLYGRYLSNGRLSAEIPFSEQTVCDAITPTVVSDGSGKLVVAWSEWQANYKYPKYRIINNGVLGEIKSIQHKIAQSLKDYTCAWYPALAMDEAGNVRGAWNQHYPATFAVYSGDLNNEPIEIGEGDIGGYPAVVYDKDNVFWVFWETYLWEQAYGDNPQSVMAAFYDKEQNRFSVPITLSDETKTVFNQTPCAAVTPGGNMLVAWSGRENEDQPWSIHLVKSENGSWSEPVVLSQENEYARAPSISISQNGTIWLAWHAGSGEDMKIKVLKYKSI